MRLDALLVAKGLAPSRETAKEAIKSGQVFIGGKRADKPSMDIKPDDNITIEGSVRKYVGRGGYKLERALECFGIDPCGMICADVGASTGGFTDCLLERGASFVYAIDVGHGQLAEKLRNDARVVSLEGVNAKDLSRDMFDSVPHLAVVDLSFVSLSQVLPALRKALPESGEAVCLIKPQFEAGRGRVGKNGIVKKPEYHADVLEAFVRNAEMAGFKVQGLTYSPVRGSDGNIEFLAHLSNVESVVEIASVVKAAHLSLAVGDAKS